MHPLRQKNDNEILQLLLFRIPQVGNSLSGLLRLKLNEAKKYLKSKVDGIFASRVDQFMEFCSSFKSSLLGM